MSFRLEASTKSNWNWPEGDKPVYRENQVKQFLKSTGRARYQNASINDPLTLKEFVHIVERDKISMQTGWRKSKRSFQKALMTLLKSAGIQGQKAVSPQIVIPNEVVGLMASYMHPSVREEGARKLCETFQITGAEQNRAITSANRADSLEIQQAEVQRIIDEYSRDPEEHPLPVNGRVYTAKISITFKDDGDDDQAEAIRFLKNSCPNMQALSLESYELSDELLEAVAECTSLKKLQLMRGKISSKGLLSLRTLTHLESFSLDIPPIGSFTVQDAQQFLGAFKFLKELNFSNMCSSLNTVMNRPEVIDDLGKFMHAVFSALGSCPTLEELHFPVFSNWMELLDSVQPTLTRLRKVCFFFTMFSHVEVVSADDLKRFGNFKSLKSLQLLSTRATTRLIPISAEILQAWSTLNLQELVVVNTFTQDGLEALGKFSELSYLALSIQHFESKEEAALFMESIRALGASLTKMKTLKICDLKNPGLAAVFSSFQSLETLIISPDCPIPPTVARELLAPLHSLRELELSVGDKDPDENEDPAIEDKVRWLDQVSVNLQRLKIQLSGLIGFKKQVIDDLTRLKGLRYLDVIRSSDDAKIPSLHVDDVLSTLAPHLSELRELRCGGYFSNPRTRITNEGIRTFQQFKKLESFTCNFEGINPENIRAAVHQHGHLTELNGIPSKNEKSLQGVKNGQENSVTLNFYNAVTESESDTDDDDSDGGPHGSGSSSGSDSDSDSDVSLYLNKLLNTVGGSDSSSDDK